LALESIPIDSNIVPRRKWQVPEDLVLLLGVCMMSWGIYTRLTWWIMGGFLVFWLGIEALPEKSHAKAQPEQKS
jgi:hypothetical protein